MLFNLCHTVSTHSGGGTGEGKFAVPIDMTFSHSSENVVVGFGSTIENGKDQIK